MSGFVFTIIFIALFIFLFGFMIYTSIKNSAKIEKMYGDLVLKEGFRDVINDNNEKNEFISKAIKVASKYSVYDRITPGKLIMKKEEDITLYVSSASLMASRESGERAILPILSIQEATEEGRIHRKIKT